MLDIILALVVTIGIPYSIILSILWMWNNEEPPNKRLTSKKTDNIIKE